MKAIEELIYITGVTVKKESHIEVIDHQIIKKIEFEKKINDEINKIYEGNKDLNNSNQTTLVADIMKNLNEHKPVRIVNNYFFIGRNGNNLKRY